MSQWKHDPVTGERVRENGRFVRLDESEEIAQNLRIRWRLIRGEVFLDVTAGTRYFGLVFEKGTPVSRIEGELADEGLRAKGVTAITRLVLTPDYANRRATVDVEAEGSVAALRALVPISDRVQLTTGG